MKMIDALFPILLFVATIAALGIMKARKKSRN
jgi:hypothetical protein